LGNSIQFNTSVNEGEQPYEWLWIFGDGHTSTEACPIYEYKLPGTYQVYCTVTDLYGNSAHNQTTVEITAIPILNIESISGGLGITAVIENIGHFDATDICWQYTISGGIFQLINKTSQGLIPTLNIDEKQSIKINPIMGFGPIQIIFQITADDVDTITEKVQGYAIFFYMKI